MTDDWKPPGGDMLADLQAATEQAERAARGVFPPREYSEGLQQLAEAFARAHGFKPPPRPAPRHLAPSLQFAIESGIMSEGQARDVDALADGVLARVDSAELTEEQGDEIVIRAAIRDGQAVVRARNRAERRAEASDRRRGRKR